MSTLSNDNSSLPSHASVVVIGGGAIGCSTLYHLAKYGISDVVLLEKDKISSGTTWHSAAQVRALRSSRNLTELIKYSIRLYKNLEIEIILDNDTGIHRWSASAIKSYWIMGQASGNLIGSASGKNCIEEYIFAELYIVNHPGQ